MSKKLKSLSGSNAPTCSPSSLTPETDKEWHATLDWCNQRDEIQDPRHVALANLCEKLERERNALKAAGVEIIEAARRSMPRKHGTIERNAKLFFPENA